MGAENQPSSPNLRKPSDRLAIAFPGCFFQLHDKFFPLHPCPFPDRTAGRCIAQCPPAAQGAFPSSISWLAMCTKDAVPAVALTGAKDEVAHADYAAILCRNTSLPCQSRPLDFSHEAAIARCTYWWPLGLFACRSQHRPARFQCAVWPRHWRPMQGSGGNWKLPEDERLPGYLIPNGSLP